MKQIRALIQSTRLSLSMSLDELARFLDVPVQVLADFESGAASIEAEVLFGLVNALNIEPEEFLSQLDRDEIDLTCDSAIQLIRSKLGS